jgi:hypothetical protein
MKIILELTAWERHLVFMALMNAEYGLKSDPEYGELMAKVAKLPCGSPGCGYCDPQEDEL